MATAFAPHTLSSFDDHLAASRDLIGQMALAAVENVEAALHALRRLRSGQARRIREADAAIDALEIQLQEAVLRTLTLHAPMADDVRELVAALRIATQFERVGDQAKSIAKRIPDAVPVSMSDCLRDLDRMGAKAVEMLKTAATSFAQCDIKAARSICDRDARLNGEVEDLSLRLIRLVSKVPEATTVGINMLWIGKYIERLGDYAVNIADEVIFMISGAHRVD